MRLPLFVVARPALGLKSPQVLLKKGSWSISSEGDAKVELRFSTLAETGTEFEVTDDYTLCHAVITTVGTDPHFSLYITHAINK